MTPADHYVEAERLLGEIQARMELITELAQHALSDPNVPARIVENGQAAQRLAAFAQVHATLATVPHETFRGTQRKGGCICREFPDPHSSTGGPALAVDPHCPVHRDPSP